MKTLRILLVLWLGAAPAYADGPVKPINTTRGNLALHGYDAVAYLTDGKAVKGTTAHEFTWNGARWRFASAANRDRFAAEPAKYAPQYGGYCAWAVSRNYTADIDPEAFAVVNGRLYLNYSKRVQRMWREDTAGNITKADANWPGLIGAKKGTR